MTSSQTGFQSQVPIGQGQTYAPLSGVYDEMMDVNGRVRPIWQPVANWFSSKSVNEQSEFARSLDSLIFENFSDPLRGYNLWDLDLAPLLMDGQTWSLIEAAACQRARLYNALLADLYGPQTVFENDLVPPQMILSDQGFLRPLCNVPVAKGHLTFLALDFARDFNGTWRILDAHTETPAGHGFALANRMVMAEVLGPLFRDCGIRRIAPFYQSLTDDLLARSGSDDPLLAVLAPLPNTSSFVGHSFMARYMGHMQVQGSDLRVLGNSVYLKTIGGLCKVDILVRAIEGCRADPLELKSDAFDGPVGLVEASRHNPDLIVNALGTGIAEHRGLSSRLDRLSHHFLGEDLLVHDSQRLWLGDRDAKAKVLSKIEDYVIHDAREGTGSPGEAAEGRRFQDLDEEGQRNLKTDIELHGYRLVAEKPLAYATAPRRGSSGLKPEPYAVRIFVSLINGNFVVMPGGIALSIGSANAVALSSKKSLSRDVWVVGEDTVPGSLSIKRLADEHSQAKPHAMDLQSRVADNLFWLGRYTERADGTLRLIRQTLKRSAADLTTIGTGSSNAKELQNLLRISEFESDQHAALPRDDSSLTGCLQTLVFSKTHPIGLQQTMESIQRLAIQCRNRMSEDAWHTLGQLSPSSLDVFGAPSGDGSKKGVSSIDASGNAQDIIHHCDAMLLKFAALAGLTHENMTRNSGWSFIDMGRRVERAKWISDTLLSLFGKRNASEQLGDDLLFALQTADSYITFRTRYRFAATLPAVLDLLIIDRTNPRSLVYQLEHLSHLIDTLPKSSDDAVRSPDQRLALKLLSSVSLSHSQTLAALDKSTGTRPALIALMTEISSELPKLCDSLSRVYFSLADETPRNLRMPS